MSITDELRKWARGLNTYNRDELQVLAIADRIDVAHEKALSQAYMDVSDSEWVRLPKDANGEVIHLGDVVMLPDWPLNHHEVINLVYARDGWAIISRHGSIEASEHTVHVKPEKPTVEDVLREFAQRVTGRECMTARPDVLAEYAAKLQLKED